MHKSQNLKVSRLILQLSLCDILKPGVEVENEDVVGPTILLPTKVQLILQVWR